MKFLCANMQLVAAMPMASRRASTGLSNEQPVHTVELDGYWIGRVGVTVEQFRAFVDATAYATDAERGECGGSYQWNGTVLPLGEMPTHGSTALLPAHLFVVLLGRLHVSIRCRQYGR